MKRLILILLSIIICLFCSCKNQQNHPMFSLDQAIESTQNALGGAENFTQADADFIEDNFAIFEYIETGAVYFGNGENTQEFGFFVLKAQDFMEPVKEEIRAYLKRESDSLSSLAALYPQGTLEERRALYQNATVDSSENLVWYFVLNKQDYGMVDTALRSQ